MLGVEVRSCEILLHVGNDDLVSDDDNDDDDNDDDDDDDINDDQDDRPAVCVSYSSCSPFMEMMANLRKPLHESGLLHRLYRQRSSYLHHIINQHHHNGDDGGVAVV